MKDKISTETRVRIKLCGLSRPEDIAAANALLPDFIGFVFAKKSPRYVTPEQAARLKALLDPRIRAVGVFVDEDPEVIREIAAAGIIGLVQLHGRETPEQVREVQDLVRTTVIKAFSVKTPEDLKAAAESPADFVLLDNGAGGTGTAFDWGILREDQDKTLNRALIEEPNGSRNGFPVCFRRPFFVAGGLTPENVGAAIKQCRPWAVDTSSALETDRKKDPAKMQAFVNAVRSTKPE